MTLLEATTLLDYHYWARDRMLEAIGTLAPDQYTQARGNSFDSVRDTAVHIYSADWVWFQRWQGTSPTAFLRFTDYPDVATLSAAWRRLEEEVRSFVADRGDAGLVEVIDYRSLAGTPGRSPFWQMLQQVVNHASYHRGQITTLLRQLGAPPPKGMDLILYYRERDASPAAR